MSLAITGDAATKQAASKSDAPRRIIHDLWQIRATQGALRGSRNVPAGL
jgi:hypothetical protein